MKKKLIKSFFVILIVAVVVCIPLFVFGNKDKKINSKTDIWEELGIEPYDENLPVVYGKEYFNVGEYETTLKKKKLPKEPFCLIVPADLKGVINIVNVKNLVDIVWLSSYTGNVDECTSLKRIVYACETEFEKCSVGQYIDYLDDPDDPDDDVFHSKVKEEAISDMEQITYFEAACIEGYQFCDNLEKIVFLKQDIPYVIHGLREMQFEIPPNTVSIEDVGYAWDVVGYECPSELKVIFSSFNCCENLRYVKLNDGLISLLDSFGAAPNLEYVIVPESLKVMEFGAWPDEWLEENPKMTLVVYKGSYGEKYAKEYNIKYIYNEDFDFEAYKAGLEKEGVK